MNEYNVRSYAALTVRTKTIATANPIFAMGGCVEVGEAIAAASNPA